MRIFARRGVDASELIPSSISGGNVTGAGEFNVFCDPEAAYVVFNAGWPITMVGLDVTEVTLINNAQVAELEQNAGPEAKFAAALARFQIGLYQGTGFAGGAIHDALAVGAAIDPSFLKTKAMRVDVETEGRFARGETIRKPENKSSLTPRIRPFGQRPRAGNRAGDASWRPLHKSVTLFVSGFLSAVFTMAESFPGATPV